MSDALTAEDVIRQLTSSRIRKGLVPRDLPRRDRASRPRALDRDPVPAEGGRGLALAQGRCSRALALVWRGAASARGEARRGAPRIPARSRLAQRRAPHAAVPAHAWQSARALGLDAARLHRCARLRF